MVALNDLITRPAFVHATIIALQDRKASLTKRVLANVAQEYKLIVRFLLAQFAQGSVAMMAFVNQKARFAKSLFAVVTFTTQAACLIQGRAFIAHLLRAA